MSGDASFDAAGCDVVLAIERISDAIIAPIGTGPGQPADRLRTRVQSDRRVHRCFNVCATGNFICYDNHTHYYEIRWASGGHGGVTDLPYLNRIRGGIEDVEHCNFEKRTYHPI